MSKINIAVIQNNIVWQNPSKNFDRINDMLIEIQDIDILVLPEMFNTGFTNDVEAFGEQIDGESVDFLKNIAKKKNLIVCASLIIVENKKFYNSFVFVKPDGKIIKYNKRHLFKIGGEAKMFTYGQDRVIADYKGVRFLLQICYDLRFPVWSRNRNDYDAIVFIANWPGNRRYSYDTLLRARAIENQSYVIAANRIGVDANQIAYDGGSCIIDYKGKTLAYAEDNKETLIYSSLDFNAQRQFQEKFPVLKDADDFIIKF